MILPKLFGAGFGLLGDGLAQALRPKGQTDTLVWP